MSEARRWVAVVVAAAVAGTGACASGGGFSPSELPTRELAGHFTMGEDASWFRPCGGAPGDTLWWTTFLGAAVAERDSLVAAGRIRAGAAAYLRLVGSPGEPQPAGPEGRGSRYLYVRDVLEAREQRAGDCSTAGGQ
jgi:hypothetical protein